MTQENSSDSPSCQITEFNLSCQIAEFNTLRDEVLSSDQSCLQITAALIAAVGVLYWRNIEWLTSFFSFIALCYFTEKRFIIRRIASYIKWNLGNFSGWEKYIDILRSSNNPYNSGLRPSNLLRPYNSELIICFLTASSPYFVNNDFRENFYSHEATAIFWFVLLLPVLYFSIVNWIEYNLKIKNRKSKCVSLFITVILGGLIPVILIPVFYREFSPREFSAEKDLLLFTIAFFEIFAVFCLESYWSEISKSLVKILRN